jgi:O-antigen ligase
LSLDINASVQAWLKTLAYVLLFTLTLLLIDSPKRLQTLAYVLVFSGLVQAVYGALSVAFGKEGVATGTFVNRNHFAAYLVLSLSVGIGILIASAGASYSKMPWRQRIRRVARLILSYKTPLRIFLAIMVIALVLTHSRMGNISFFSSLLITGILALILLKDTPRPIVLLISSLIVIDLVIIGSYVGIERVKERIEQTTLQTETRDEVDIYSWRMWQDYPLVGSGAGSYYGVFPRYRQMDVGRSFYDHAHDDYLELLSEYGLIGFTLLGMIVLSTIWQALTAQRRRRNPWMRGMAFAALMATVAMLIHATVEFHLHIPAYASTLIVLLAIAHLARHLNSHPIPSPNLLT